MNEPLFPFTLRMKERLRARLEREAKVNGRSMNSELIAILEEAFAEEDRRRAMGERDDLDDAV